MCNFFLNLILFEELFHTLWNRTSVQGSFRFLIKVWQTFRLALKFFFVCSFLALFISLLIVQWGSLSFTDGAFYYVAGFNEFWFADRASGLQDNTRATKPRQWSRRAYKQFGSFRRHWKARKMPESFSPPISSRRTAKCRHFIHRINRWQGHGLEVAQQVGRQLISRFRKRGRESGAAIVVNRSCNCVSGF